MDTYNSAGIYVEKEERDRVDAFLTQVEHLFWSSLSAQQRSVYDAYRSLRTLGGQGMTIKGYLEFMRASKELTVLTQIPFSLEADYAGLGSWDAWDAAVTKAFKAAKSKQKRKTRNPNDDKQGRVK
jgi:hypothetical protein